MARLKPPQDKPEHRAMMEEPGPPAAAPPRGAPAAVHALPSHPGVSGTHPIGAIVQAIVLALDLDLDRQDCWNPDRLAAARKRRPIGPEPAGDGETLSPEEADA